MNRTKLLIISLAALFVGGLRDSLCTANVNDRGTTAADRPKNEMVELLAKGAGVDPEDVYWRVARGLSPKQAVDVAAQEKLERAVDAYAGKVKDKDDAEIRDLAQKAGVDPSALPDMSRQQMLIAIVKLDQTSAGLPLPGEEIPTTTKTELAPNPNPADDTPPPPAAKPAAKKPAANKSAAKKA